MAVGTKPETDAYTTVIQADDEGIGKLAGEYIVKNLYDPGEKIVVIQEWRDPRFPPIAFPGSKRL